MSVSVFAKIINQELPAEVLYENADYLVILSIAPHNTGHSLVLPKKSNSGRFWDMPEAELSGLVLMSQRISQVLMNELKPARIGLVFEGFGVTDWTHVNLIPINQPGDLDHDRAQTATPAQLAEVGKRLRAAIQKTGTVS